MIITEHAVNRFKERVTVASYDIICNFIENDVQNSSLLYSFNGIEKRMCNGIIYVIDPNDKLHPVVITLYLC